MRMPAMKAGKKLHKYTASALLLVALPLVGVQLFWERSLTPVEYIERVEDPEGAFLVEEALKEAHYSLQHRPPAFLFLKDKGPEGSDREAWEAEKGGYTEGVHFHLRLRPKSGSTLQQWIRDGGTGGRGARYRYFSFGMKDDLELIGEDEDTLQCRDFHFERTYGHTPYLSFLLSFSRKDLPEGPFTVLFQNSRSADGPVRFRFDETALVSPPELEIPSQ